MILSPVFFSGWRDGLKAHGLTISDAEFYGHAGVGTEEIVRKLAKQQVLKYIHGT